MTQSPRMQFSMQFQSTFSMSKLIYFKLVGQHRFKFIEYI